MNKTKIEWVRHSNGSLGRSWNPVTGCEHGCPYCYARKQGIRFTGHFKPTFHPERLDAPMREKKPQRVFVCSMADLLGEWVPDEWIRRVLVAASEADWHTYFFLTKNPARYRLDNGWTNPLLLGENTWIGFSAKNQIAYNRCLSEMPLGKNGKRFIS